MNRLSTLIGRGMGYLLIATLITIAIFIEARLAMELGMACAIIWLITEIFKKNGFYTTHSNASPDRQLRFMWNGAKVERQSPAMRRLLITSMSGKEFTLLVGFRICIPALGINWFHAFGEIQSIDGQALMTTWMGKGECEFLFLSNIPANEVEIRLTQDVKKVKAIYTYWPHWYQQWPFYFFG